MFKPYSVNPSVEAHLDNVFQDGARQKEKDMKAKTFQYKLNGRGYTVENGERGSGRCIVESVRYDKSLDCNVIRFKDIDTGKTRSVCQFEVTIKEETN